MAKLLLFVGLGIGAYYYSVAEMEQNIIDRKVQGAKVNNDIMRAVGLPVSSVPTPFPAPIFTPLPIFKLGNLFH